MFSDFGADLWSTVFRTKKYKLKGTKSITVFSYLYIFCAKSNVYYPDRVQKKINIYVF